MLTLDSVVGELHIVNGQRQSATHFTGAFTAPRRSARGRQDDTLFILVDPTGSNALIPDLLQRIQTNYWQVAGSVTAGLRAAIEAGNAWLVDQNPSAIASTRAGVTCVVLRGTEIFIAQAGPSCAYVAHQGAVERFPRGGVEGSSLPPLGIARAVEVRFSHAELHPGDTLLLTDGAFPSRMPLEAITSSIVYVGVEAALNNLARLSGSDSLIAMIIEVTVAQAIGAQAAPVEAKPAPQPVQRSAPQSAQAPAAPTTPAPAAPKVGEWAGALRQGVGRGIGSLGTGAKAMVQRTLPDRPAPPSAHRRAPRGSPAIEHNLPLMIGLAAGIPIVVAILVTAVYLDRSTAAQVNTLVAEARKIVTEADAALTTEAKRERWQAALAEMAQALELDPGNATAIDIRSQVQAQLDRLDGTLRVSPVLLYDFKKAGRHRLALSDIYLFVMDQAESRIDRLTLTSDGGGIEGDVPAPVVAKGITVGGRTVGDLIDMVWVDAGGGRQKSTLVVLERGGLIEYDLSFGVDVIPFGDSTVPSGARRIDTYDGNLYLLDTAAQQVWRYVPAAAGGYAGKPEPYFETPPAGLSNAIDMAIDGNVYVLAASGAVGKYLRGNEEPFSPSGLPEPISRAAALAVDPRALTASGLYVADAASARVIHFAPDGRFIRQARATGNEFDAIEDILVDDRTGRLYVISGGRLYSAALPRVTAP